MNQHPLARLPFNYNNRSQLRSLFKQYLEEEKTDEKLSWQTITTADGLPHNWIYDLYQDSQGVIWVGTWGGGLAKREGQSWRTYTIKDGLHSNEVTCIRQDPQGSIWLATDNGMNRITDGLIVDAGLRGKSLLNIAFDRRGYCWAGCWRAARSGGGLYHYDGKNWTPISTRQNLPGMEILKVFIDSQDRLWIGTYEQGTGAGVGYLQGNRWHSYTSRDGLVNDCVYSMFEDPSGNMWFGTIGGVSIFDGKTWNNISAGDGLVDNRIYSMLIDSHKKMWFGTEGGVSRFDGKTWVSYTKKDGLVENLVRSIIETTDGSLWFGTYPYAKGLGGISVARYQSVLSLTDRVLDLLPEPPSPKLLPNNTDAE